MLYIFIIPHQQAKNNVEINEQLMFFAENSNRRCGD